MSGRRIICCIVRNCGLETSCLDYGNCAWLCGLLNDLEYSVREHEEIDEEDCGQDEMLCAVLVVRNFVCVFKKFSAVVFICALYCERVNQI